MNDNSGTGLKFSNRYVFIPLAFKINAVNNIMWAIADLGKINLGDTSSKLEELGARLILFGNKVTEYVKGINTVSSDDLQSSKDKIDKIIEIANTLGAVSSDPIEQLVEKLKNFATDAIKKFVDCKQV